MLGEVVETTISVFEIASINSLCMLMFDFERQTSFCLINFGSA